MRSIPATISGGLELIASPGAVFTGAERRDFLLEARAAKSCELCIRRKAAVSPYAADGTHEAATALDERLVDAVHRIATDPGRLSTRWYRELTGAGTSDAELVEMIAVVCTGIAIDTLHRGLGLALPELPGPRPGEPDGMISAGATVHSARVPTVHPEVATGAVAALYSMSDVNILRSLTLVPSGVALFFGTTAPLYPPPDPNDHPDFELRRPQMELIATTVANYNDCFY